MTRDEAIRTLEAFAYMPKDRAVEFTAALTALGVVKLDEPKPDTRRLYCKCAISGELAVVTEESAIEAVRNAGYTVGRAT